MVRKYGYSEFTWKDKYNLYLGDEKIATLVPKLFLIKWADGTESDIYNLTRAKDNAIKGHLSYLDSQDRQQTP